MTFWSGLQGQNFETWEKLVQPRLKDMIKELVACNKDVIELPLAVFFKEGHIIALERAYQVALVVRIHLPMR